MVMQYKEGIELQEWVSASTTEDQIREVMK